jgi:site-specific DNA recombinase
MPPPTGSQVPHRRGFATAEVDLTDALRARATADGAPVDGDNPAPTTVATYTRRSTDEEHQRFSIEMQDDRLEKYIASQDCWQLASRYSDDMTGSTLDRPGLQRLLRDARSGRFRVLLVYRVDRLARTLRGLVQVLGELDNAGVVFRSATEPFDTALPAGRMMVQLLGVFAEFERATIIERVVGGMERKATRGEWTTGVAPFGYRRAKGEPTLTVDEDEALRLRAIFESYASGEQGVRTLTERLNRQGSRSRRGRLWSKQQTLNMLRNRVYIGEVFFRGTYRLGLHQPLIPRALFDQVQTLLKERGEDVAGRPVASDFLLSGTIICARCGHHYVGVSARGRWGGRFRYYVCQGRSKRGRNECAAANLPARPLEEAVLRSLSETFSDPRHLEQAIIAAREEFRKLTPRYADELAQAEAELRKTMDQITRYLEAFEAGTMPDEVCGDRVRSLETRRKALHARCDELTQRMEDAPADPYAAIDLEAARCEFTRLFDQAGHEVSGRASLLRHLIHEIRVAGPANIMPRFRVPMPGGGNTANGSAASEPDRGGGRGSYTVKIGTPGGTRTPAPGSGGRRSIHLSYGR